MANPRQFRLSALLGLLTLCGLVLGIAFGIGYGVALPLGMLPICLYCEWMVQRREDRDSNSSKSRFAQLTLLTVLAGSVAGVGWYACSAPTMTILSPVPLLVAIPGMLGGIAMAVVAMVGTSLYFLWPVSRASHGPVPLRVTMLLALGSLLSFLFFASSWSYGVEYQGAVHTRGVAIVNGVSLVLLWGLWSACRPVATLSWRITLVTLLLYWLFGAAFPYLGEY